MQITRDEPGLTNLLEQTEADAWIALSRSLGDEPLIDTQPVSGAIALIDRRPEVAEHHVFGLGLSRPVARQALDEIVDIYRRVGAPSVRLHVTPTARPPMLRRWLEEGGFKLEAREAILARPAEAPINADPFFRIREAVQEDSEALIEMVSAADASSRPWARLVSSRLEEQGWRYYLACSGSRPVAVAGMYVGERAAWLGPALTLPEFRKQGAHGALIAHRILEARRLGCDWVTTQAEITGSMPSRTFARAGFELMYVRSCYVWQPAQEGGSPEEAAG